MIPTECSGRIAQVGEHRPYKPGVTGSSPVPPTMIHGDVVKTVITPACHAGGRRFKSGRPRQTKTKGFAENGKTLFFFPVFLSPLSNEGAPGKGGPRKTPLIRDRACRSGQTIAEDSGGRASDSARIGSGSENEVPF